MAPLKEEIYAHQEAVQLDAPPHTVSEALASGRERAIRQALAAVKAEVSTAAVDGYFRHLTDSCVVAAAGAIESFANEVSGQLQERPEASAFADHLVDVEHADSALRVATWGFMAHLFGLNWPERSSEFIDAGDRVIPLPPDTTRFVTQLCALVRPGPSTQPGWDYQVFHSAVLGWMYAVVFDRDSIEPESALASVHWGAAFVDQLSAMTERIDAVEPADFE